jgi:hypothetical protein
MTTSFKNLAILNGADSCVNLFFVAESLRIFRSFPRSYRADSETRAIGLTRSPANDQLVRP